MVPNGPAGRSSDGVGMRHSIAVVCPHSTEELKHAGRCYAGITLLLASLRCSWPLPPFLFPVWSLGTRFVPAQHLHAPPKKAVAQSASDLFPAPFPWAQPRGTARKECCRRDTTHHFSGTPQA